MNHRQRFALFLGFDSARSRLFSFEMSRRAYRILSATALVSFSLSLIFLMYLGAFLAHQAVYIAEDIRSSHLRSDLDFVTKMTGELEGQMKLSFRFEDNLRFLYGVKSLSGDERQAGIGGYGTTAYDSLSFANPQYPEVGGLTRRLDKLTRQSALGRTTLSGMQGEVVSVIRRLKRFPSVMPVMGRVTSGYGNRFHPIEKEYINHDGIDIGGERWTPIYATADGVVDLAEYWEGYGNLIVVNHGYGYQTYYGHLQDFAVKSRQFVVRGDLLGYLGNTGRTTGPHLHYEIRRHGKPMDPLEYMYPVTAYIE